MPAPELLRPGTESEPAAAPVPASEVLRGLGRAEEQLSTERYFSAFLWERPTADPEMLSGDFLDAL